eukprot:SAG25_NODE_9432_length_372_cov_1.300366_2_plen_24_part_01
MNLAISHADIWYEMMQRLVEINAT